MTMAIPMRVDLLDREVMVRVGRAKALDEEGANDGPRAERDGNQ